LQLGPHIFSNAKKQENKREQAGPHFSKGARPPWAPRRYGADNQQHRYNEKYKMYVVSYCTLATLHVV